MQKNARQMCHGKWVKYLISDIPKLIMIIEGKLIFELGTYVGMWREEEIVGEWIWFEDFLIGGFDLVERATSFFFLLLI